MNTTSTQTDLTGVTLTITLSEYEKLREMKKTNDTLLEELENMTKAYNEMKTSFDKERATTIQLYSERSEREDKMLEEHTARVEDNLEDINNLTWEVRELKAKLMKIKSIV